MLDKEKILEIVSSKISKDENIGEHAGGSGHLSSIGFTLDEVSEAEKTADNYKLSYKYTISVTTEFTIYPDNPPHEYSREVVILVNEKGEIIKEISSRSINDNFIPFDL